MPTLGHSLVINLICLHLICINLGSLVSVFCFVFFRDYFFPFCFNFVFNMSGTYMVPKSKL